MNIQKKLATAIAAGSLLLQLSTPVFAQSTTLQITGNGADSDSEVNLTQTHTTQVGQTNVANISNNVDANADTGNNDANYNTNGDVSVDTGDATSVVSVDNQANTNVATVDGCCEQDVDVLIDGNGYGTDNDANLTLTTATNVYQNNVAVVNNDVDADADTGDNDANYNTSGDVSVTTGDAGVGVLVKNNLNNNFATIGGGNGEGGSVSLRILGNGAYSDNEINLTLARATQLQQENVAIVSNDVDADAETGDNDANKNTGGEVSVDTGDAMAEVVIDNMVNFNFAEVGCDCLLDVFAKVAGNGAESDNDINATLADAQLLWQTNVWECESGLSEVSLFSYNHKKGCNDVDADADSGDNDVNENTGSVLGGDPSVETGDADAFVEVGNSGNVNVIGDSPFDLPELPEVEWDFDFGGNFGFLLGLWSGIWS